jgi:hypothetical protein
LQRVTGYRNYITRAGDTFDALALTMYNEEKLSHYIIGFNPDHADVIIFGANVSLRLPIVENAEMPETLPPWRRDE